MGFLEEDSDAAFEDLRYAHGRMGKGLADTCGGWIMGRQITLVEACLVSTIDRHQRPRCAIPAPHTIRLAHIAERF